MILRGHKTEPHQEPVGPGPLDIIDGVLDASLCFEEQGYESVRHEVLL